MAYALWRETRMSVAGHIIPCMSLGMSMTTNPKEIKVADGLKTGNALKRHSRGRAQSSFTCRFNLFADNAPAFLNAILSTTPFAIAAQYGDAGGESAEGYTLADLDVSWANGGEPEGTATFRTSNAPVPGATVAAPTVGDYFVEQDVTVVTLPGGNHTKLHRFSFRITRTLAEDYGNQPQGLPFSIDQSSTSVRLTAEYRKEDDSEEAAFATGANGCPTHAPCGVILTQVCPTNGTPATLALDMPDGFHENYPEATGGGNIDNVVYKNASILSDSGSFAIG